MITNVCAGGTHTLTGQNMFKHFQVFLVRDTTTKVNGNGLFALKMLSKSKMIAAEQHEVLTIDFWYCELSCLCSLFENLHIFCQIDSYMYLYFQNVCVSLQAVVREAQILQALKSCKLAVHFYNSMQVYFNLL